jgi:hypothetical protein
MSTTTTDPLIVKLTKRPVRLSYPNLFTPKSGPEGGKAAYSASFLLDKKRNAEDIAAIRTAIEAAKKAQWNGKPVTLKGTCLRDGAEKEGVDGYGPDVMFISARNEKRPGVVGPDLTPLTADDNKPYAGCYVYATIRVWAQDNKFGKRVNASLRNVQFVKDGAPFGEKVVSAEEDFEAIDAEAAVV